MVKMQRFIVTAMIMALVLMASESVFAEPLRPETQRDELLELKESLTQWLQDHRPQKYYDLKAADTGIQGQLNADPNISLMYLNEKGRPVYYILHNLNAAKTISTDDVWSSSGSCGFSLSGGETEANQLGLWDGQAVLTSHQEFDNRVEQVDTGNGTIGRHATHVAGTMIAAGVDADAKGMSHEAELSAYCYDNDLAEMAGAAADGMNVSNHSYGVNAGYRFRYWDGDYSISRSEDWKFGFYDTLSANIDSIAYLAPYYTPVYSAGNDRVDYDIVPDSSEAAEFRLWRLWVEELGRDLSFDSVLMLYDTIPGPDGGIAGYSSIDTRGTPKNTITVGSIQDIPGGYSDTSDVIMTDYSCWGPTDDGRIKPDIVANGDTVYSCYNSSATSYISGTGTSSSAPSVAGSLNLLVRFYERTHGDETPLSAMMKAVIFQTADEAGDYPGPDYKFGWGLMNTCSAAELIYADSANQGLLVEQMIANSQSDTYEFTLTSSSSLRITMVWTDPPGSPPTPSLNPTDTMLVHDLDMELENLDSSLTYLPYKLDPANPDSAATTGDNDLDNVEQIYIATAFPGDYRLTISHDGILNATQYYTFASSEELTLTDCYCGDEPGDLNDDAAVNPVDMVIIVNYVYRALDSREYPEGWNCPFDLGDVNCDGSINPVDVVYYTNCVYQNKCFFCDGCME